MTFAPLLFQFFSIFSCLLIWVSLCRIISFLDSFVVRVDVHCGGLDSLCLCVLLSHPQPSSDPCTVDVLPGPTGVTTHPDRMMSRQSANSCVVLWRDVVTSEWSCARG